MPSPAFAPKVTPATLKSLDEMRHAFAQRAMEVGVRRPPSLRSPFLVGTLEVQVFRTHREAGHAAAYDDMAYVLGQRNGLMPVLVARARSQLTRWNSEGGGLSNPNGLGKLFPFEKLPIRYMDEFLGQPLDHAGSLSTEFRRQVPADFYNRLRAQEPNPTAGSVEAEMARYVGVMEHCLPFALVTAGIGTGRADGSGAHMAFMDPPWADLNPRDPRRLMVVKLPEWCRKQQATDFGPEVYPTLDAVPEYALSVTMAVILNARRISCLVVGDYKAAAVARTLTCEISADDPASSMREHPCATLYLDEAAAGRALSLLQA